MLLFFAQEPLMNELYMTRPNTKQNGKDCRAVLLLLNEICEMCTSLYFLGLCVNHRPENNVREEQNWSCLHFNLPCTL